MDFSQRMVYSVRGLFLPLSLRALYNAFTGPLLIALSEAKGCYLSIGIPDEHHLATSVAMVDYRHHGGMLLLEKVQLLVFDPVQVRANNHRDPALFAPFGLLEPSLGVE
ncbi:unnamed protein product [Clonostachys rhizophaga]|uniref:Uncharacterized protein n=1 Tax=Clonostachys rhizophaga TaxID=160324 RepID=A0A9N9VXH8_9HYPO|nr:unnamed protein product [Clonostachys rhizophaga]